MSPFSCSCSDCLVVGAASLGGMSSPEYYDSDHLYFGGDSDDGEYDDDDVTVRAYGPLGMVSDQHVWLGSCSLNKFNIKDNSNIGLIFQITMRNLWKFAKWSKKSGIAWLCTLGLLAHSRSKRHIKFSIFSYLKGT